MVYRPQDRIWTASAPTGGPLSVADLSDHLRVTGDAEDAVIGAIGYASAAHVEAYTQRLLTPRTCTLLLSDLPAGTEPIELPGGAVVSLTSVVADGVTLTGCSVAGHSPALLLRSTDWPTVTGEGFPVTITYVAGMTIIPFDLRMALKLISADLYENRANSSEMALREVPISACRLMDLHRIKPI